MKAKYPLIISLLFVTALVLNNKITEWKTYRFYSNLENIDDPIREELKRNEFLSDEAEDRKSVV